MADYFGNLIKIWGGATELAVDLADDLQDGMLAYCPFEKVAVWRRDETFYERITTETRVLELIASNSLTEVNHDDTLTGTGTILAPLSVVPSVNSVKLWNGFVTPEKITIVKNDATRTYSLKHTDDSPVEFRCKGVVFSWTTGAPELSVVLPAEKRKYFLYFNDSGQYSYQTVSNSDDVLRNNTIGTLMNLATDDDINYAENMQIHRLDEVEANPVENFASMKTKTISATSNPVSFIGSQGGSIVGYTDGEYFSNRDFQFFVQPMATPPYQIYYLNGLDADSVDYVDNSLSMTGEPYITNGATLFYNEFVGPEWELSALGNNKYILCHLVVADGDQLNIVAMAGQKEYGSLSTAQSGIETERSTLVLNTEIFKEVGIVATCIFKSNSGVGEQQYVDSDNNLFDYPQVGVISTNSPSATTPSLSSVLSVSPEGDAQGKPISNLPDGINPQDPSVVGQSVQVDGSSTMAGDLDGGGFDFNNAKNIGCETITVASVSPKPRIVNTGVSSGNVTLNFNPNPASPLVNEQYFIAYGDGHATAAGQMLFRNLNGATKIQGSANSDTMAFNLNNSVEIPNGDLDMNGNKILNVDDGDADTDGVNFGQVNGLIDVVEPAGWVALPGRNASATIEYCRKNGIVFLRGKSIDSEGTLPINYRPSANMLVSVRLINTGTIEGTIAASGTVQIAGGTGTASWDGFSFPAEQ